MAQNHNWHGWILAPIGLLMLVAILGLPVFMSVTAGPSPGPAGDTVGDAWGNFTST
jgi:hypothetical protein